MNDKKRPLTTPSQEDLLIDEIIKNGSSEDRIRVLKLLTLKDEQIRRIELDSKPKNNIFNDVIFVLMIVLAMITLFTFYKPATTPSSVPQSQQSK